MEMFQCHDQMKKKKMEVKYCLTAFRGDLQTNLNGQAVLRSNTNKPAALWVTHIFIYFWIFLWHRTGFKTVLIWFKILQTFLINMYSLR